MIGLFCIDPGGHTGVAWGIVDERSSLAAEAVKNRIHSRSVTFDGDPMEQARALYAHWVKFKQLCVQGGLLDPDQIELVIEDFVLYGGPHAGGRDGTAPLPIIWAFEGYRWGKYEGYRTRKHITPITFQKSSQAFTYKSRKRLESAGAWIVGKEHERSAFSHMILRVNTIMSKNQASSL